MKVTLNWLRQYVDFPGPAEELADRLTMLGLELENLEKVGGEFEGVVVAQVLTKDRHPNADKLWLCRVNDGRGERQIVCGAQNFQAGDKVPLILPGASLSGGPGEAPFTIKVGKIRGVESHGMMCSPQELRLGDSVEGLLLLPADAKVGQPFAEHLGRSAGDAVLDFEVTPNRPDLNSVIGIAREVAAVTGAPLRLPEVPRTPAAAGAERAEDLVAVRLEAPDLCPRYTARVLRGVKIGPSPDWLRSSLEKVGVRSINNVVDVTNYVMLETGQPLHAFDYHLIARSPNGKPTIVVRRAADQETFVTLDDQTHQLTSEMLLIADEAKGIALAGVMGGQNTEIQPHTVDVLLESAWFLPSNIRRTSKKLGLKTDASYRFERGVDIDATEWASLRAAQLMLELAGGTLADGVVDAYPQPQVPKQITLRHHKANELLGLNLAPAEMEFYLGQLGLKLVGRKPQPVGSETDAAPATFLIPPWRPDLKREVDLTEEIARLHGVEKIPATPPRGAVGSNPFDAVHDELAEARRILTGLGLHEAQGQTLVAETAARLASANPVALSNPLSSDMNTLRPSLLPGLLDSLRHNLSRQNQDVALFELGRVFAPGTASPREARHVAIALTGRRQPDFWQGQDREARYDLYDLKGVVDEFLELYGLRGLVYAARAEPTALFADSATVSLGGRVPLGQLGLLLPALARQHDLRDAVLLAELDLDELLARRNTARTLKPLPQFPSVRRDIAMLVPESVSHEAVLAAVRQAKAANLETVDLFDVFRGKGIPAGQKSVAYAFTYRHAERTLTDAEVNAAHDKLVAHLTKALGATVRA